jgi:hypothetical protein
MLTGLEGWLALMRQSGPAQKDSYLGIDNLDYKVHSWNSFKKFWRDQ